MNAFLRKSLFLLIAVLCTSFINAQYRYIDATFDVDIPAEWTQESTAQSNSWGVADSVAVLSGSALDVVSVCISSTYNLSFQGHIKAEQHKKLNNEKIQTSKQFMHSFCAQLYMLIY